MNVNDPKPQKLPDVIHCEGSLEGDPRSCCDLAADRDKARVSAPQWDTRKFVFCAQHPDTAGRCCKECVAWLLRLEISTLFTIGHSRHAIEHFVSLLRAHAIERLVDVRSHPSSKWVSHFDRAALAQTMAGHAVDYVFLGRQLGGRPEGAEFYRQDGRVDYERRAAAPDFEVGIGQLVELARVRRTAILCAEEDPARCHRRLLVAPALRRAGLTVVHIRGDALLDLDACDPAPTRQLDLFGGSRDGM